MPSVKYTTTSDSRTVLYSGGNGLLNKQSITYSLSAHTAVDVAVKQNDPLHAKRVSEGTMLPVLPYHRTIGTFFSSVGQGVSLRAEILPSVPLRANGVTATKTNSMAFYNSSVVSYNNVMGLFASERAKADITAIDNLAQHILDIEYDVMVDVLEADKTAKMFVNRFQATEKFVQDFIHKRGPALRYLKAALKGKLTKRQRRKLRKDLNDLYLEFTYGWGPLAGSLNDATALLSRQLNPRQRNKVSGKGMFVDESELSFTRRDSTSPAVDLYAKRITHYKYTVYAGGLLVVTSDDRESLIQNLGLSFENVLNLTWELTPFSFLLDYVTNIDQILRSFANTFASMRPGSTYLSRKVEFKEYVIVEDVNLVPLAERTQRATITGPLSGDSFKTNLIDFDRSLLSANDMMVPLSFQIPTGKQIVNTLSIAFGLMKNSKERIRYLNSL